MSSSTQPVAAPGATGVAFTRILCAVDGTRSGLEAAAQAVRLAGDGCELTLLAVTDARGTGQFKQATLSVQHAIEAVAAARALAEESPATVQTVVAHAADAGSGILAAAEGHELVVVGGRHQTRLSGILLGRTAAKVVHLARVPVLVARRRPGVPFPSRVVVATRGPGDLGTVSIAARVARASGTPLALVQVGTTTDPRVHAAVAEQTMVAQEITGGEPPVQLLVGHAAVEIARFADATGAGLLVVGSHGRSGAAALRSVSERLAFRAPCSVLVVRPRHRGRGR